MMGNLLGWRKRTAPPQSTHNELIVTDHWRHDGAAAACMTLGVADRSPRQAMTGSLNVVAIGVFANAKPGDRFRIVPAEDGL